LADRSDSGNNWTSWLRSRGFGDLFNLKSGVPDTFDELTWQPGEPDQQAAWMLYTELRTRITTQKLALRHGDEATALDSVYKLFELSRTSIKTHYGCAHFAALTVRVLNTRVRPFAALWHKVKTEGRLSNADVRFRFRAELNALQLWLRKYTELLAILVGEPATVVRSEWDSGASAAEDQGCWEALPFEIAAEMWNGGDNRTDINAAEAEAILLRRQFYYVANTDAAVNAVGLSISGGGIRSATFGLGVVQTLARRGILRQVDYLSAVSGGGSSWDS
jgi:hypothetical protein